MGLQTDSQSSLERFFDNFFHERNIRWMLGIGVMILFGSSVMLVTQHWGDMTPFWKCLVVMGYTAVAYGAAEVTYGRLGLRMTGTVLKSLTLLLIPVSFLSLNWLSSNSGTTVDGSKIGFAALMVLHGIFCAFAARRIFIHFLRTEQTTLLVSYLLLCFAGAIVPAVGPLYPMTTSLLLWAMFAAGSVKSARHIFWMSEEHKLPRIFGFFPILLLGIQFGLLFGFGCASHLATGWLGFGCTLIAIPILLTANTVADVYEKRTGGLIRPLPARIILPLTLGAMLCPIGVALAITTLPNAFALAPAAIVSAILMAVVARRTQNTGFAWMMVAFVCVAYKFSPVYFQELAAALRNSAAQSLNEDKLPLAFYGLTCLPLMLVSVVAGRWFQRSGEKIFAKVLPQFAVGGSMLLTMISITNLKAAFVVPAALAVWFVAMAVYLADRRILFPAMAAVVMSSWTAVPFLESVVGWNCGIDAHWIALTTASLLILAGSRFTDTDWLPIPNQSPGSLNDVWMQTHEGDIRPWGRYLSAAVSMAASVAWVAQNIVQNNASLIGWLLLTTTLVIQAGMTRSRAFAGFSIIFGLLAGVLFGVNNGYSTTEIINGLNLTACGLWIVGCLLMHRRNRLAECYAVPAQGISTFILMSILFCWHGPHLVMGSMNVTAQLGLFDLLLASGTIAWCFQSAVRMRIPALSCFGTILVMPLVSASMMWASNDPATIGGYPLWWAVALMVSLLFTSVADRMLRTNGQRYEMFVEYGANPIRSTSRVLLTMIVLVSLPMLFGNVGAAVIALVGIAFAERGEGRIPLIPSVFLANWYGLAVLADVHLALCPAGSSTVYLFASTGYVMAAAAAVSALLFRIPAANKLFGVREYGVVQRALLHITTFFALSCTTVMLGTALSPLLVGLVLLVAAIVFTDLMLSAVSLRSELMVWEALFTVLATVAYLIVFGVIDVDFAILSYGLLGISAVLYLTARAVRNSDRLNTLCGPFEQTSRILPAVTLPLALASVFAGKSATWLGGDSQALLLAGAFYFWTGLQTKRRSLMLLAMTFMNVALVLLWFDLKWNDPQLFMIPMGVSVVGLVQLLKREIPTSLLNPLRYVGALMILVSPTFHIVSGSWLHLFSLMVVSVLVILAAIGLRLRALVYTGTAFLAADLIAMVCRGSFDHPNLLWVAGLCLGASVIGVAAVFEGQREKILGRIRVLSATLESWE